jgi:2-polyprenyl-3-methyl-5-hydroxy-6-metoxy-1,4-benzoquinol methylase
MDTLQFWDSRAQQYAREGDGLRAVCSYAMPNFYNRAIDMTQKAALADLLASIPAGAKVLDFGCGVGRWSHALAQRGCQVTAVDFSANMLSEAARRSARAGLSDHIRFVQADVAQVEFDAASFDIVFGVTVLQHVLSDASLHLTLRRLARLLRPGGRMILMEAAPQVRTSACETATFRARSLNTYLDGIVGSGLEVVEIRGVDPTPFKLWLVPRFRHWPQWLGSSALALATLLSLPLDLLLARRLVHASWHKVIVAAAPRGAA